MRRNWIVGGILALVVFALAGASIASAEEPSSGGEASPLVEEACQSGNVCVWPQENYQGVRSEISCSVEIRMFATYKRSAKNRCASKDVILAERASANYTCMTPAGNRPSPPAFNEIVLGNWNNC
jgi:hypothetical protein